MRALRLSAVALAVSSLLAVAWTFSTEGCGGDNFTWECASPSTGANLGTANNGDPNACPCMCCSAGPDNSKPYPQGDCPFADAGTDGGPLPGECSGQCWPGAPLGWSPPLLLWVGEDNAAPPCPVDVAPIVAFDGIGAGNTYALACTSTASGSCPGLADVCGPAQAGNFWPCVSVAGAHACVSLSPYTELHVFNEPTFGPTTFCCLPSPISPPTQ